MGVVLFIFFFFQAEDGIRDLTVTGVQTCALPISLRTMQWTLFAAMSATVPLLFFAFVVGGFLPLLFIALAVLMSPDYMWWLLGGIHLAVYGPILFLASRLVAKFLLGRPESQQRYL